MYMYVHLICTYRIVSAEKQYITAFKDELGAFVGRVKQRAKVKLEEAMKEAEEVGATLQVACTV